MVSKENRSIIVATVVAVAVIVGIVVLVFGLVAWNGSQNSGSDVLSRISSQSQSGTSDGSSASSDANAGSNNMDGASGSGSAGNANSSSSSNGSATTEEIPRLPKIGMSASLIDATKLGPHDEEQTVDSGMWAGGTSYMWHAKNGTGDLVFTAIVQRGEVVKVTKNSTYKNYWDDGTILGREFPDMYASGEPGPDGPVPALQDPIDYDSPDDFADDNQDYFKAQGSKDPWGDAYAYWEKYV